MMVKVSVIVPVYNGETYLRECLDSIQDQTLREIEILCVDDGSTDDSMKILEEYTDNDDRFQIYSQGHQFAGSARNLGMSHAKGEYLAFWDCDDFFDLQALEKLYEKGKQTDADVIVCGGYQYLNDKQQAYPWAPYLETKYLPDSETFNRFTNPQYYLNFTNAAAWNKLFKRSFIEEQGLKFQQIRNGNDVYFTVNAIGLADKIATVNEKLVTYRSNQGTGLVSSLSKSPLTPIQAWLDIAENLEKHEGFGEQSFANKAAGSMLYMLLNLQDWEAFRQAVEALQSYGLKGMHIFPKEGFYYSKWNEEYVNHLYTDKPEQLAVFLMHLSYRQKNEAYAERRLISSEKSSLVKENKRLNKEAEDIRNSVSFRIGRFFTWLPGKIKRMLKS